MQRDKKLYERFIHLITSHFTFVPSFSHPVITPEFLHLYHRRKSVSDALISFVQELKRILDDEVPRIENLMCKSRDYKRPSDSNADMVITEDESVVDLLNNKVREP